MTVNYIEQLVAPRAQQTNATLPVQMVTLTGGSIILGCVDNGLARQDIARQVSVLLAKWWIDAGNGDTYGQVVIGNSLTSHYDKKGICDKLPLPTIQCPELTRQVPAQLGCAEDDQQSPTINIMMAAIMAETVRQLINGTCSWYRLYLDCKLGTLTPVYIHT